MVVVGESVGLGVCCCVCIFRAQRQYFSLRITPPIRSLLQVSLFPNRNFSSLTSYLSVIPISLLSLPIVDGRERGGRIAQTRGSTSLLESPGRGLPDFVQALFFLWFADGSAPAASFSPHALGTTLLGTILVLL